MSLSNPSLQNPATKFLEWCSQTNEEKGLTAGTFYYFDKEEKKNVTVKLPLYFVVLDQLSTIKGFHKQSESGIFSNEVKFLSEPLYVRSFEKKGGFKIVGKYADIKSEIVAAGGKYTKSIYAVLIKEDGTFEIVNFQLKGASFAAFMDAKLNTDTCPGVCVKTFQELKNGANKYQSPVFEKLVIGQQRRELWQYAHAADKQLQAFIKSRKQAQAEAEAAKDEGVEVDPIENADFLTNNATTDECPY